MKKKTLFILFMLVIVVWVTSSNAVNAAGDYIYETDNNITICDPDDEMFCITMQDRNLWATSNDITSDKSFWYHFQWWNNHWFQPWKVNTVNHVVFPNWETIWSSQIDCSSYGPWNPLDRDVFIAWESDYFNSEFDYCDTHNYNLWWWGDDYYETNRWYDVETYLVDNAKWRQWPCPDWYHIPSNGEWQSLLEIWAKHYWNWLKLHGSHLVRAFNNNNNSSALFTSAVAQFREDFKIPLAGSRDRYRAYLWWIGQVADFWSSSPYIDYDAVHSFSVGINSVAAGGTEPFANANSIRCFKNIPITLKSNSSNISLEKSMVKKTNSFNTDVKHNLCAGSQINIKNIFARIPLDKTGVLKNLKCVNWK